MQTNVYDQVKTNHQELVKKNNQYMYVIPRADIRETEDQFIVLLEMPGVNKDGLRVFLEGQHLVVEGLSQLETKGQLVLSEILKRNYRRVFKLSSTIQTEKIEAKWLDGILYITLNKQESAKPREINIQFHS